MTFYIYKMDLPLDVKFVIASFDINLWIKMAYIDDEFKQFSYTIGRKIFIDLFTVMEETTRNKSWKIFDKLHREDDKPAVIYSNGQHEWRINNKRHRENDQPAVIYVDRQNK